MSLPKIPKPQTSLGFILDEILGGGANALKQGYDDRRYIKDVIMKATSETWIIANKVDKKSERVEKFRFKIIRGKKIDGRMKTLGIVKSVNILKQGKL